MRIASKSLMSIKIPRPSFSQGSLFRYFRACGCSVFDLEVDEIRLAEGPDLLVRLLDGLLLLGDLDVLEVAERLVGRQAQLAVLVDPLLTLLGLLGRRLPLDGPQRAGREVDAELLRGAEQLVLL